MKQQLITAVAVGQTLDASDTQTTTKYYNYLFFCGASHDAIKVLLNGMEMTVPCGTALNINVNSLTVVSIAKSSSIPDADLKVVAYGVETKNTLFGN